MEKVVIFLASAIIRAHGLRLTTTTTWETLSARTGGAPRASPTVLTLYRDTNGWCPFCERVWIALEKKGIAYDEVLINLYDKPKYYTDMIPTGLVPAIEIHDGSYNSGSPGSGELVYESSEILKRLDVLVPNVDLRANEEVPEVVERALSTAYAVAYGGSRNATAYVEAMDALDAILDPFVRGEKLSAADLVMVPMMERYRYQLDLFSPGNKKLLDGKPGLRRWFAALEADPAYRRVAGDEYSWTATAAAFLRIFGNATDDDPRAIDARERSAAILEAAEADAEALEDSAACLEAATKLVANHRAVVDDACNVDPPKSQTRLTRLGAADRDAVDATLRVAAAALLDGAVGDAAQAADPRAARLVASRLCAPRDMSAPAARSLRHVLMRLAAAA
ncbi:hypothetical protein CTAYLR_002805 [Chrysophaeum taylorii]|uniref:Glutathione transferase n=1 Tax=Chrysophaeum taylorii TaxID=2483200 RepID=A0AAD7XG22_9STRA|nr:hypothetical protein CTAYLR_002805 [Chrysophaeum taylorii]